MTGRKGRIVRGPNNRLTYELRARPETSEMDSLNGGCVGCVWLRGLPSLSVGVV